MRPWEQGGVGAGGCKGRGCRAAPNQGLEGAGSQTRFLCWIISFQQFYCNYPENAAIYRVSQTAAVPGGRGKERERMGGQAQGGGGRRRQERKGNQTGRRVMAGGWLEPMQRSQNSNPRKNPLGREKEWRDLLGPQTLGPSPHVDNGPRGPREWQQIPMDLWEKMGLDLLIPVHCPPAAQCHHSPPLPCGCQGNWANTTPAGSSKPSPHPTKPPDACRKGKAGYPLPGKEEVREAEPNRLVLFHFFLQRQPSLSPLRSRKVTGSWEDFPVARRPTPTQACRRKDPTILMAARVPCPRKQAQASTTIPYQEWRGG